MLFRLRAIGSRVKKAIMIRIPSSYKHLGIGSSISRQARVVGKHGISIGDHTHILPYALIQCGPWSHKGLVSSPDYPDQLIIGDCCTVQPYAFISTNGGKIEIGNNCSINAFCMIYGYGGLSIGNNVRIANGCVIVPSSHNIGPKTESVVGTGVTAKGIRICDNVWLGSRVVVLDGVTIGKGSVIGAGAVVNRDIPAGVIAAGVPARIIKEKESCGVS